MTVRQVHWRDDAEALTAILRLAAVPVLIIGERFVPKPEPTETGFLVAIAAFSLYAVGTLALLLLRSPSPLRAPWLAAVDVAFAGILSFTSGGGFSQLRFAFLFAPVTAAFRCRPAFTASVSGAAVVVYALQALSHPSHSSRGNSLSFVVVQVVYLAWLGAGLTLLSLLLERRERAVGELSAARQWLVAEALAAEERERQRLAEDLHDHAIQNLLAARHELHDRADADPAGSDAMALAAMTATIQQLRTSISDLHPLLLDHPRARGGAQPDRPAGGRAGRLRPRPASSRSSLPGCTTGCCCAAPRSSCRTWSSTPTRPAWRSRCGPAAAS